MNLTKAQIDETQIIVTTPEKWNSESLRFSETKNVFLCLRVGGGRSEVGGSS